MNNYKFNDQQIVWNQLPGFDHLSYQILDVDREKLIVDVLFKFSANEKIALHRHVALNHMFVIQGEHRIYSADGRLTETRPTGRYTVSHASKEPHQEGGGVKMSSYCSAYGEPAAPCTKYSTQNTILLRR
tara:strand:- start:199 stop:588 length:390 start_codon:yes stop_codon:yes gene_type:complete